MPTWVVVWPSGWTRSATGSSEARSGRRMADNFAGYTDEDCGPPVLDASGLANGSLVEYHSVAVEVCKQVFDGLPVHHPVSFRRRRIKPASSRDRDQQVRR